MTHGHLGLNHSFLSLRELQLFLSFEFCLDFRKLNLRKFCSAKRARFSDSFHFELLKHWTRSTHTTRIRVFWRPIFPSKGCHGEGLQAVLILSLLLLLIPSVRGFLRRRPQLSRAGEQQVLRFAQHDNPVGVALGGTAEAGPFPFEEEGRSFRGAEALRHPK